MDSLNELTEKYIIAMLRNPSYIDRDFIHKEYPESIVDCARLMAKKTLEHLLNDQIFEITNSTDSKILYIGLLEQPPEWAKYAQKRGKGFELLNEQDGQAFKIWPDTTNEPLVCPAEVDKYWTHGDTKYLIIKIFGLEFQGLEKTGRWFWKVKAKEGKIYP